MSTPSLAAWQEAFAAYLQHGTGEGWLSAQTTGQHIAPELRLDVYRHAYYARLQAALAHDFPALLQALGDHDFGRLMAEYLRAHPSTSPTLRDLGHALPAWLRTHNKAEHADLAAIEWAVLHAFDAADAQSIDADVLAQTAPEDWASLHVVLHPSMSLLKLHSNAAEYWQLQRKGTGKALLAPAANSCLVISRSVEGPVLVNVTEAQHAVFSGLHRGETLASLCAQMTSFLPSPDIPQLVAETLARAVESGWVCAIESK